MTELSDLGADTDGSGDGEEMPAGMQGRSTAASTTGVVDKAATQSERTAQAAAAADHPSRSHAGVQMPSENIRVRACTHNRLDSVSTTRARCRLACQHSHLEHAEVQHFDRQGTQPNDDESNWQTTNYDDYLD